jgi:hypothetical protein
MRICTEWAEKSYQECTQTADQGYNACAEYQDQGYNDCSDWDANCCDWWPCSWGCKLISWICVAWYWVSNLVCVAWVWVSNVVCVMWTTITTLVCVVWTIIEVLLTPIAWLAELILSIPIIGRLIDEFLNFVEEIFWRIVGLGDAFLGLLGIRPLKKIYMCIIILKDEAGNPTSDEATLQPAIDAAKQIYLDEANVLLIIDGIHTVDSPSPTYALDVGCNVDAWGEDLWLTGSYFKATAAWHCALGGVSRLTGLRHQLVAFCVRNIPGTTAGCALGPINDYLTIEGRNPICLAHGTAHKLGLWHCCPGTDLANPTCGGTQLEWWQVLIIRDSKFASYI